MNFKESLLTPFQAINKSLSALGDVLAALRRAGKGGHVPYRNSKLTHLLQGSLSNGGSASEGGWCVYVSRLQRAHPARSGRDGEGDTVGDAVREMVRETRWGTHRC